MAKEITKKDLKETTSTIIEAMDFRFKRMEKRMGSFEEKLDNLATLLNKFLKRFTDFEDEFTILKYIESRS